MLAWGFALPKLVSRRSRTSMSTSMGEGRASELVLLGSGVSTALPRINCVLRGRLDGPQEGSSPASPQFVPCEVCRRGASDHFSPNRRCNVSAVVRLNDVSVLIDCGKTVRESCMRHLPMIGVQSIEAVVLTHGHADAMLGLDDLRDIQTVDVDAAPMDKWWEAPIVPIPVHLSSNTMEDVKRAFPYLVPEKRTPPAGDIQRRVSKITWSVFEYDQPFVPVPGCPVTFTPIRLFHGGDYICAGFVIEGSFSNNSTVAYLSDLNALPPETMEYLRSIERIDLLVVDSLLKDKTHSSHFSLRDAIALAKVLRPKKTVCVGMTCSVGLHEDVNPEVIEEGFKCGLDISLGYDGLRVPL